MPLQLFVDLLSQPCRSVYIFAKTNNLDVDVKLISLMDGEQHTKEFEEVNPLKKAPALKDGDFCMAESIPMLEYMAEKYNTPDHWYPKDLQKRSRVRQYMSWQHLGIRLPGSKLFWMELMIPELFKMEVPKDKKEAVMTDFNAGLDTIESTFIQSGGFIGGDKISIADLVAIVEIMQPLAAGVDVFKGREKLRLWKERVVEAVGKELFDDAHAKVTSKDFIAQIDLNKVQGFKPRILRMIS